MDKEIQRIIDFIRYHVDSSKVDGVVVGVSGGLDSSVVTTLAVRAIGAENVHCVFMPSITTPDEDYEDVGYLMKYLDIQALDVADIDDLVTAFNIWREPAKSNIKARIRMTILYAEANAGNYLVLGTSDKSEIAIGYFTKWGDGAADILPIAHLYKTEVRQLARALGLPERIIKKPSSPALIKNQTAEDDLGFTYDEIDRMLKGELPMHSKIEALVVRAIHKQNPIPRLS